MKQIPQYFAGLCSLIWPTACIGCDVPDLSCCESCLRQILDPPRHLNTIATTTMVLPAHVVVLAARTYGDMFRKMLVAYKHGGRTQFVPVLGQVLESALLHLFGQLAQFRVGAQPVYLVSLPSTARAVRRRGFQHLELLLSYAARKLRRSTGTVCLRRAPNALGVLAGRRSQVGLRTEERQRNARLIQVRYRWRTRLQGKEVVLFDDIVTTGASIRAAYDVLTGAGAHVIGVVVLSVVERIDERDFA